MASKTPGGEKVVDVLIKTGANVDVPKKVIVEKVNKAALPIALLAVKN